MLFKALCTRSKGPSQIHRQIILRMSTINRALPSSQAAQHVFHRNATIMQDGQGSNDLSISNLKQVLQDYKLDNFKQTLPSRFKKEIVVAIDPDRDGYVSLDDLDQFIVNIGMAGRISKTEVEQAFSQLGLKQHQINQSPPVESQHQPHLAAYASLLPVQEVIDLLQIPSGHKA